MKQKQRKGSEVLLYNPPTNSSQSGIFQKKLYLNRIEEYLV